MRKRGQADDTSSSWSNKKSKLIDKRSSDDSSNPTQSKIDATYGQRGAFPGLDDTSGNDELFYGPANDGLEYLRMVRHEAKGVPNLLVAPSSPRDDHENLYREYPQGFYSDGAYTAAPLTSSTADPQIEDSDDIDPQEAYYTRLLARFVDLHSILHSAPTTTQIDQTAMILMQNKRAVWRGKLLKTTPTMRTLSQIPQESIIYGLKVLGDLLTQTNLKHIRYGKNLGAWSWALLGACRQIGEMGSEEVGVLRDVGKQAVWLLRRVAAGEVDDMEEAEAMVDGQFREEEVPEQEMPAAEGYEEGGEEEGDVVEATAKYDADLDPVVAARHRLLSSLRIEESVQLTTVVNNHESQNIISQHQEYQHTDEIEQDVEGADGRQTNVEPVSQANTLGALDMVVTVVGEVYGQRDLLDGRLLWDEI